MPNNSDKIFRAEGPAVLCILDGWGHRTETAHNAVALASTPAVDALTTQWPTSLLAASGTDVGLPEGQVGNSEVGHMNIGAGRIVMQDLPRINAACKDGSLAGHTALQALAAQTAARGARIHVMGLLSGGGVHSHSNHMLAVVSGLAAAGGAVTVHGFTDGRDVLPKSAQDIVPPLLDSLPTGVQFGTLIGRYFAMDRDNRWDRTGAAFDAIAHGAADSQTFTSPLDIIDASYRAGITDEFILPHVLQGYEGMRDGDAIVMINFRADRVRQLLACWLMPDDTGIEGPVPAASAVIGMTAYSDALDAKMETLFAPQALDKTLGAVVAEAGRRQLRLAETEKYPHVTFFLNGGVEDVSTGETRELVPSPRVATYDLQPEMSAEGVLDIALGSINKRDHDLIIMNFANPDMVGHTGDLQAAIVAVSAVDDCVGRLATAVLAAGGQMLLTADHGNCEVMWDEAHESPHTAHTTNLVPCTLVGAATGVGIADGRLADLAPSLLAMLGIEQPAEMTGTRLQQISPERGAAEPAVPQGSQ